MNHRISSLHIRLLFTAFTAIATPLVSGCASVQTHSFQSAQAPDRLPELAYDEVRKGLFADHHSLLGPVQIDLEPRGIAEFPVILERGRCYRAIAVEEERKDPLRLAVMDESFLEQGSAVGRDGVVTMLRCPDATENLILAVEGVSHPARVVVGLLLQP